MAETKGPTGKHSIAFMCPVPVNYCSGTPDKNRRYSFHGIPEAVLKCQQHYLKKQGFKKLSKREFEDPENGRVLVLSRRPARHKPGKQDRPMPPPHIKVAW